MNTLETNCYKKLIVQLMLPLDSRVTRVVGDSGAVLTIETTRNSELIDTIFKKIALKMVELSCIKGLANNCQNKTSL